MARAGDLGVYAGSHQRWKVSTTTPTLGGAGLGEVEGLRSVDRTPRSAEYIGFSG